MITFLQIPILIFFLAFCIIYNLYKHKWHKERKRLFSDIAALYTKKIASYGFVIKANHHPNISYLEEPGYNEYELHFQIPIHFTFSISPKSSIKQKKKVNNKNFLNDFMENFSVTMEFY